MKRTPWREMPPGPERRAARARYFADYDRARPIASDCRVKQRHINGRLGIQGPSKVVHFYDNDAQKQIATWLARTRARPFPHDLLSVEMTDGQLIVACKSGSHRLPLAPGTPPRCVQVSIDALTEIAQKQRSIAQPLTDTTPTPDAGNEPATERQCNV
jgi:hypothetical protein